MDEIKNNQSVPGQVPEPPIKKSVDIRTMASDMQSVKQTGGGAPEPKQFNLGSFNSPKEPPTISQAPQVPEIKSAFSPPSPSFPAAPITPNQTSSSEPVFVPGQEAVSISSETPSSGSKKNLILSVVGLIILGVLFYLGYFYVYPSFFGNVPEVVPPVVVVPEVIETPPPMPKSIHVPFVSFSLPNVGIIGSVQLSSDPLSFKASLSTLARSITTSNTMGEFLIEDSEKNPADFSLLFSSLVPEMASDTLSSLFEQDFTALIYFDDKGRAWPGYIAKLRAGVDKTFAAAFIKNLENSASLPSNLLIENFGTPVTEGFKDGQIVNLPARYLSFSDKVAAIDYFFANDYFVIISSYSGAKNLIPLLSPQILE